ncbi:MAG TPA: ester cyclase [Chloroflexia bacterium]|nr:ester cyclase [Chloroflexia bacterium]
MEENKHIVSRYFEEVVNRCQLEVAAEVLTAEMVAHMEPRLRMRQKAVPDWCVTIERQVAEGDIVVTIGTTRGTHSGEWFTPIGTLAPTGKHFAFTFTSTMRLEGGRIAQIVWSNWDWLELLQQLGAVPRTVVGDDEQ